MAFISKKIELKKIPKYISNLHYNRKNSKKKILWSVISY